MRARAGLRARRALERVLCAVVLLAIALPARPLEARAEAVLAPADGQGAREGSALRLEEVVGSADRAFPLLVSARLEGSVRDAELRRSRGGLDTRLRLDGELRPLGYYESSAGSVGVEQPTTLWGARLRGGYRVGSGDAPSYDGGRLTDEAGEVSAGFALPLLRGGSIDPTRAEIERRGIDVDRFAPELEIERIAVRREAASAYWRWVGAGLALDVAERLLDVAVERQEQIEGRVRRGAEPEIDLVDNERLIVDRRMGLRRAERDFVHASLALSLYLRDEAGEPQQPVRARLPAAFPVEEPPVASVVERDLQRATATHPAIRKLDLERERHLVDADLARNDALPAIDLDVSASQDLGGARSGIDYRGSLSGAPRSDTEVRALLRFEMPVQRRSARARAEIASTKVRQVEQRIRFERDRLAVDTGRIVAELDAAFALTVEARRNLELAERLRVAEERRLALGYGNLIDVNIRELQAAGAARALIDAQVVFFLAVADYEAVVARPVDAARLASTFEGSSDPTDRL